MKALLIALAFIAPAVLIGCKEEMAKQHKIEEQTIQKKLPAGCTFSDLGFYDGRYKVLVVQCDGKKVTTFNITKGGKHKKRSTVINIG